MVYRVLADQPLLSRTPSGRPGSWSRDNRLKDVERTGNFYSNLEYFYRRFTEFDVNEPESFSLPHLPILTVMNWLKKLERVGGWVGG